MSHHPKSFALISTRHRKSHVEENQQRSSPSPEHIVNIDLDSLDHLPCVFTAPKTVTDTKPEAYRPQKLGLGPYHHRRPDLYPMQWKKFVIATKFLKKTDHQKLHYMDIEKIMELLLLPRESLIRASYDKHVDLDPSSLARIVAVDATYLLHFFSEEMNPNMKKILASDILMLENQIPGQFLLDIRGILDGRDDDDDAFVKNLRGFCERQSPLELTENIEDVDILELMKQGHLLNVMYNLILPKETSKSDKSESESDSVSEPVCPMEQTKVFDSSSSANLERIAEIATAIGVPGANIAQKELSVIENVPWAMILEKLKKFDPDHEENSLVDKKIRIPPVSKLTKIACVKFARTEKGIRGVRFDEREKKLYLPAITLHSNSEVVLRNLLVYEAASANPRSTLELAQFVDLMYGIVDTAKDVEILREAKIVVKGDDDDDFTDAEIVRIFNGIRKSPGDNGGKQEKTEIGKAIKKVNEMYGNTARVKVGRFVKKYLSVSWKFLGVISSVMFMMFLGLQALCLIYDCRSQWSMKSKYNPLQVF